MLCGLLDVRESQRAVGIGDVDNLIEPRNGVAHMLCVGEWFFPLFRKRVDAVGQITLRGQRSVFFVGFPSGFRHVFAILSFSRGSSKQN
jgi:hypothetical protein